MKHKKDTSNVKSVNKPSKSPTNFDNNATKTMSKELLAAPSNDCHQDIVKRLMTHSQYFPSNPNSKPVSVTYSSNPTFHHAPYAMSQPQYSYSNSSTYNHQVPAVYENTAPFGDYYAKDFYYQQPQSFNQFGNINTCLSSPSLSSPSTHNNFDQISNGSPRSSSNYVFNGDFTLNFNADFDGSFPLIDGAKTQQLFDNQAPVEIKSFEAVNSGGQLTPVTIESQRNDEIKSSFDDVKRYCGLVSLSDDDVLSDASCNSRPSPAALVDYWRFAEHQ
jgi:hypothetical protein